MRESTKKIIGKKFGGLLILSWISKGEILVRCDCGKEYPTQMHSVKINKNGCKECSNKKYTPPPQITHGKTKTKEYYTWRAIRSRCRNPKNKCFSVYGGRGITVDPSWNTFEQFYRDMGDAPTKLHSIDRIDNNKGYSKGNCRWATVEEQARNKRTTVRIEIDGIVQCQKDWCQEFKKHEGMVLDRTKRLGWNLRDALFTPAHKLPSSKYSQHIKSFKVLI